MTISNMNNKVSNLAFLKKRKFNIPELNIFKITDFFEDRQKIINKIQKKYKKKIAIRSSAKDEDGMKFSNAGKYKSFVNINTRNKKEIEEKILNVIKSYKKNTKGNVFFVQSMVRNIKLSGVVLTRDINSYSPYFVINFHRGSDSTLVTSGRKRSNSIKYFPNKKYKIDFQFRKLVETVIKLKKIFRCEIDVEFCIDKNNKLFILQVRKLNLPKKDLLNFINEKKFGKCLNNLEKKIIKLKKQQNNEYGNTTYFGVMPDWNPAEIIGKKPKPLALSLYRELITDHIWSENRYNYGFKDINQFHLMTTFFNTPFIDIKVDFNSWLPRDLDEKIQKKLINFYLKKFNKNKHLHDKIEKEIIYTCYSVNIEKRIKKNLKGNFTNKEISYLILCLKKINNLSFQQKDIDLKKIKMLINQQNKIENSNLYFFDKIYWHVENCKRYGTLPFAGLARCGFIAIEILESLERARIFQTNDKNNFLNSIKTISSEITNDFIRLNKSNFLSKYGHLRPNSYEITSPNYNQGFKKYFKSNRKDLIKKKKFQFSKDQRIKIKKFIKNFNPKISFEEFIDFIKSSIQLREYSKFIFMRSIDLIFKNLKLFAKKYKINFSNLSYLKINDVTDFYYNLSSENTSGKMMDIIKRNKSEYLKNFYLDLPDVILSPKDLYVVNISKDNPNYITDKICEGEIIKLNIKNKISINNKIVCIENADPGFDFIFSHKIKGLITKYGGFNSHMSIRCSELSIPAIIGVGENDFKKIVNSKKIYFDCKNNNYKIV